MSPIADTADVDVHELAGFVFRKLYCELTDAEFARFQDNGVLPADYAARARENWTLKQQAQVRWAQLKSLVDQDLER